MIDIWYLIGMLALPIVVVIVAILMRLFNRTRNLERKHYIIVGAIQIFFVGINVTTPIEVKVINTILTIIILTAGYFLDKSLKREKI